MELAPGVPKHTFAPVRPGDIKYKDVNEDGLINSLDECPIGGTADPQIVYGFGASVLYKQVDFSFFFKETEKPIVSLAAIISFPVVAMVQWGTFIPIIKIDGRLRIRIKMYFGHVWQVITMRIIRGPLHGG